MLDIAKPRYLKVGTKWTGSIADMHRSGLGAVHLQVELFGNLIEHAELICSLAEECGVISVLKHLQGVLAK